MLQILIHSIPNIYKKYLLLKLTLFFNISNAMSLDEVRVLYSSCFIIRSIGISNGVAPSSIVGSKFNSPKRANVL